MNEEQIVSLIFFGLVIIVTILKPFIQIQSTFNFYFYIHWNIFSKVMELVIKIIYEIELKTNTMNVTEPALS